MAESKLRELSMEFSVDIIHLTNQGFSPFSRWHLFCQHVPSVPVLKDAGRKTRDFLGFSSFFSVFLTFLKFCLKQKQKDAKYRFRPSFRNRTGERQFQGGFQRDFLSENRPFFVFFKNIIVE